MYTERGRNGEQRIRDVRKKAKEREVRQRKGKKERSSGLFEK